MCFEDSRSILNRTIGNVLAVLWLLAGAINLAHADTTASTDDKSVDVPTAWWSYTNESVASIATLLDSNHARLTDIEPYTADGTRFTVTMVGNSGAYAVPGWWWYVGQTADQVSALLGTNNARLIDIEPYSTASGVRFAAIMVSNTGAAARNWHWGVGVASSQITSFLDSYARTANPQRLTDLASYTEGGVKKYVFIAVSNTGADNKGWEWWLNQSAAGIGTKVNAFGGRITSLERQSNGTYNFIQVKNAGTDNHYWLYYFGLSSLSTANSIADQYGARVFDVETYVSGSQRLYNALLIDNAGSETRRIRTAFGSSLQLPNGLPNGQWGAWVKPLGADATISLNGARRFEPASAIKAVHDLAVMERVKDGADSLSSPLTYYNYPAGSTNIYPCPSVADETPQHALTMTLAAGKNAMMDVSDNRTTRGIVLRMATDTSTQAARGVSGLAAIEAVAVGDAQMMDTFLQQDLHGCGHQGNKRNLTTLQDLGKVYEGVESGALLGTGTFRSGYWQAMNGGAVGTACDDYLALFPGLSCVEPDLRATVQEEGASLGKSSAVIADFIARMEWRHKPGIYDFPCSDPFTPCTAGHIEATADAGRLTLPRKARGGYSQKKYVFGTYAADNNLCDAAKAAGDPDSCVACPQCTPLTVRDAALRQVRKELFRSVIRENLASF